MGIKTGKIVTAKNIDFLNKIGASKNELIKPKTTGGVYEIIQKFGTAFANDLAKKLNAIGSVSTGALIDSFSFKYYDKGTVLEFTFSLNEYYKYLDQGRKAGGKFPWDITKGLDPTGTGNVIYQWVKTNGYSLKKDIVARKSHSKYSPLVRNQLALAYLIGNRMKRKGTKGNKFWTSTVNDGRMAKLSRDLSKALGFEVIINIKNYVNEIKK